MVTTAETEQTHNSFGNYRRGGKERSEVDTEREEKRRGKERKGSKERTWSNNSSYHLNSSNRINKFVMNMGEVERKGGGIGENCQVHWPK